MLESLMDLQHAHVAAGCDNSPTMAWASHLISLKDTTAAHLLRALSLRMLACQASPLAPFHMADFAS